MDIKPIKNDADHEAALIEIASLMHVEDDNSADSDRLDVLAALVENYEAKQFPVDAPDPIEAIKFMMDQKGLTRRDIEPAIGGRGRVSEVLGKKRPLTLDMIRALRLMLGIPADILIGGDTPQVAVSADPIAKVSSPTQRRRRVALSQ